MDEQQIDEIADRVVEALNGLAPREPEWWEIVAAFGSYAVLAAAIVALVIGSRTLRQQGEDLRSREAGAREALVQRQEADERAEWWRRAQWALEAASGANETLADAGVSMLKILAVSELARPEDKELLAAAWRTGAAAGLSEEMVSAYLEEVRSTAGVRPGDPAEFAVWAGAAAAVLPAALGRAGGETDTDRTRRLTRLRREISLAQLRVVLDQELGRKTPDAVIALSRIPLPPLSVLADGPSRGLPPQGQQQPGTADSGS